MFFDQQDINRFVREELSYLISNNNKHEIEQDSIKTHENSSSFSEENDQKSDRNGNTTKVKKFVYYFLPFDWTKNLYLRPKIWFFSH